MRRRKNEVAEGVSKLRQQTDVAFVDTTSYTYIQYDLVDRLQYIYFLSTAFDIALNMHVGIIIMILYPQ